MSILVTPCVLFGLAKPLYIVCICALLCYCVMCQLTTCLVEYSYVALLVIKFLIYNAFAIFWINKKPSYFQLVMVR